MSQAFSKIRRIKIDLSLCPFCSGTAEWVQIPGEDYIMRCSKCHASTTKARWTPEEAAADWNAHDIVDDHYTITADTKIDRFLKPGVQKVLLCEYSSFDEFPQCEEGFLCGEAVIITDEVTLVIEPKGAHLLYDELSEYNPEHYRKNIAPNDSEIKFARSKWRKRNLLSLEFKCGDSRITIASKADYRCMIVRTMQINELAEANRDWRYCVVGNITKTHIDGQGILRYGSSAFRGGTKVYLCGKYWNKEHGTIGVIGLGRYKRYVYSDVSPSLIENVRCQRAYNPSVLALMDNWEFYEYWWGKDAEDKAETQRFADDWNNSGVKSE